MTSIVQLARRGDIVNILPFVWGLKETVDFYVHEDFADILEACSYVNIHTIRGDSRACNKIGHQVRATYVSQVDGNEIRVKPQANFTLESWARVGAVEQYHALPLVFDKRDRRNEPRLSDGKNLVVCLHGHSSPFPLRKQFLSWLYSAFGSQYQITDISNLRLAKSHHLLGILESATVLLTIDTLPLHLSYATHTPTICLTGDRPWYQSERRPHWIGKFTYSECMSRESRIAIGRLLNAPITCETIHHVTDWFLPSGRDRMRVINARKTWESQGEGWVMKYHDSEKAPRTSQSQLGDSRKMPFIKDIFDFGIEGLGEREIVVFTNADICLMTGVGDAIREKLTTGDCCYSRRLDVKDCTRPPKSGAGVAHVGADLFACRAGWWRQHRDELPDLIYSCEGWDFIARRVWKKHNPDAEISPPVIYHEIHNSFWMQKLNIHRNPGQVWNREQCTKWAAANDLSYMIGAGLYLFKPDEDLKPEDRDR